MWKSRSPGVDGAACPPPVMEMKGRSSAGRAARPSRSHAADPMPTTHERFAPMSRNPTVLARSSSPATTSRAVARSAESGRIVTVRNTANCESGASTCWASIGTRRSVSSMRRLPLARRHPPLCSRWYRQARGGRPGRMVDREQPHPRQAPRRAPRRPRHRRRMGRDRARSEEGAVRHPPRRVGRRAAREPRDPRARPETPTPRHPLAWRLPRRSRRSRTARSSASPAS